MSNIDKRSYRADGGDIGTGRLKEIADNVYGDEEKNWLAKRVLELLDDLDSLESFRTAFTEFHNKTEWVQGDKRFDVIKPWGKHRADALKEYIDHLEGRLEVAERRIAEPEELVELFLRAKALMHQSGGTPIENSLNPVDAWLYDAERAAAAGKGE